MTIEEKAKAYDEAIAKAKEIHHLSSDFAVIIYMEKLFPELSESEDEKMKNFLIDLVKELRWTEKEDQGWPSKENVITWLEKQEAIPTPLPHKYNQGDWIVSKYGGIYQVKEVLQGGYNLLCESMAEGINSSSIVDNSSRLMTMRDILEKQKPVELTKEDKDKLVFDHLTSLGYPCDANGNIVSYEETFETCKQALVYWLKQNIKNVIIDKSISLSSNGVKTEILLKENYMQAYKEGINAAIELLSSQVNKPT